MPDRWVLPAYTGPDSPQTPVRIPDREEVNHMTAIDEPYEAPAETPAEAEEAQAETDTTGEADDSASDSPE